MSLRFDGRVAIVTGAGAGLGRAYALALAARGAKVVVNDLGGSARGEGSSKRAADKVVDEIVAAGGSAVANYDSVEFGDRIVETAISAYGRVDIVVNNAGVLRDRTLAKMTDADWDLVYRVHLKGSYAVTRAAWPHMRKQNYGRVVNITSSTGLYGNLGQSNYGAMKLALVGFTNTLAREGERRNIRVNVVAPTAATRMTEDLMPEEMLRVLKPAYVSPLILLLLHESSEESGGVFEVGAGWFAKLRWQRTRGASVAPTELTPERVAKEWATIGDFERGSSHPDSTQSSFDPILASLESEADASASSGSDDTMPVKLADRAPAAAVAAAAGDCSLPPLPPSTGGSEAVNVALAMASPLEPSTITYTEKDAILYALGVGAGRKPAEELPFVYEMNGDGFHVLPTMAVLFTTMGGVVNLPGLSFNPMMLLHGEQYIELAGPLPPAGTISTSGSVSAIYDKGSGALVHIDSVSRDASGKQVAFGRSSLFIRGIGGFGGARGPKPVDYSPPSRAPDAVQLDVTREDQAALYRLNGDNNPLHVDPAMAAMGGFDTPILHGLCFYGIAGRAVLKAFCGNDPAHFKAFGARFVKHVFPGETLRTEMWLEGDKVLLRVVVVERDEVVLSNAFVQLRASAPALAGGRGGGESAAAAAGAASPSASRLKSAPLFAAMKQGVERQGADLVKKVRGVVQFIVKPGGAWVVDLKTGTGSVREGKVDRPDLTFTVADDDFVAMAAGKLNPQKAFMRGKLKLKGNMALAQKLGAVLKAAAPASKL
eukprot:PLAT9113.2.p1 GENE.PLAT9113.2~~PLAT9113.2.p1  ORF type:complete len:770 (+),score=413.61 PLAT9113.2:9-2318(+)